MKRNTIIACLLVLTGTSIYLISCKKLTVQTITVTQEEFLEEPQLPQVPDDYAAKYGVESNIATLGRVLFYDRSLSESNTVSCGSCHKQQYAFANNVAFDKGFDGRTLKRNTPSIQGIEGFNTSFANKNTQPNEDNQRPVLLFWDGRQSSLADMVLNPVLNHNEMHISNFATLVNKLKNKSYYPKLFLNAYGSPEIDVKKIAFALEAFVVCLNKKPFDTTSFNNMPIALVSSTNQFDPNPKLSPIEQYGQQLFHVKYNCATCHDPVSQTFGTYGNAEVGSPVAMFNIGLDESPEDLGLAGITHLSNDAGVFKVPTLKNISLTAPYMHDGRFNTLDEVLNHYSHGIQNQSNLPAIFKNTDGSAKQLNISATDRLAIIAFLNTLVDKDFISNPMFADPFVKK